LLVELEMLGLLGFSRPSIPSGSFALELGAEASVLGYENDTLIRPGEAAQLYEHLTGDIRTTRDHGGG